MFFWDMLDPTNGEYTMSQKCAWLRYRVDIFALLEGSRWHIILGLLKMVNVPIVFWRMLVGSSLCIMYLMNRHRDWCPSNIFQPIFAEETNDFPACFCVFPQAPCSRGKCAYQENCWPTPQHDSTSLQRWVTRVGFVLYLRWGLGSSPLLTASYCRPRSPSSEPTLPLRGGLAGDLFLGCIGGR